MSFKLQRDQRHDFQATAGQPVTVGISAPATTIASAYYNGTSLPPDASGHVTFTPLVGTYFLTIATNPPFPPEAWSVVEVDTSNGSTQVLEAETSDTQIVNLPIVGN